MPNKKAKVIKEPEKGTRTILHLMGVGPVITGAGDLDILCGDCNSILVKGIVPNQIQNMVIQCPTCKSFNDI